MYKVSGPDFAKALYEQAKELGAEIGFEAVTKVNKLENGFEIGYIVASEDCKTSVPGIFVAGDVRTSSLKQLVTATADGARAATEAVKVFSY